MSPSRIYADFHNLDDLNRIKLTSSGTREDLNRHGIELREGLILTFYMDDADDRGRPDELLVEGVVHYDADHLTWVADVDWSMVRHDSAQNPQAINTCQA